MITRLINHNTPEYEQMIDLRWNVLLQPIGVPGSFINREAEKKDLLIGAYENDVLIACCILTPVDSLKVQLRQMAVHTDFQGKNIGRAILSFAEVIAKEKRYKTVLMHARDEVIPFYIKCGYFITDNGFTEVGIPHHTMEKEII